MRLKYSLVLVFFLTFFSTAYSQDNKEKFTDFLTFYDIEDSSYLFSITFFPHLRTGNFTQIEKARIILFFKNEQNEFSFLDNCDLFNTQCEEIISGDRIVEEISQLSTKIKSSNSKITPYDLIELHSAYKNSKKDYAKPRFRIHERFENCFYVEKVHSIIFSSSEFEVEDEYDVSIGETDLSVAAFGETIHYFTGEGYSDFIDERPKRNSIFTVRADTITNLSFNNVVGLDANVSTGYISNLSIKNSTIDKFNLEWYGNEKIEILIDNITLNIPDDVLDLSVLNYIVVHNLTISENIISKLKFDYRYFQLDTANIVDEFNYSPDQIIKMFHDLVQMQNKYGFTGGEIKSSKELKEYTYLNEGKYVTNFVQKHLWGYGYDKFLIFKYILCVWLFFTIVNFFFRRELLYQTYPIEQFREIDSEWNRKKVSKALGFPLRFFNMFVYTGFLFWGIKVNLERLKLKPYPLAIFVVVQYCAGIFFLALIVNQIIAG